QREGGVTCSTMNLLAIFKTHLISKIFGFSLEPDDEETVGLSQSRGRPSRRNAQPEVVTFTNHRTNVTRQVALQNHLQQQQRANRSIEITVAAPRRRSTWSPSAILALREH